MADDAAMDETAPAAEGDSDSGNGTSVTTAGSGVATQEGGDEGAVDDCPPTGSCDGCEAWQATYQGPNGVADAFLGIAIAPDGTIVAAGRREWVQDAGAGDTVLVGYAATGEQLWESTPLGVDNGIEDYAQSIAFASDGRMAVVAWRRIDVGYESVVVVLDVRGQLLWTRQLVRDGVVGYVGAASFTETGELVVVGSVTDTADLSVGVVQNWSEDGEPEWELAGDDFEIVPGFLGAIAQTDTALFVAGGTYESSPSDVWLARIGVAGEAQWVVRDEADSYHWAGGLAVLPGEELVVVGAQYDDQGESQSWAGRFAADGTNLWSRVYPAPGCCANHFAAVVVDDEARAYALGARGNEDGDLLMTIAELDCAGEIAWEWNHESPGWNTSFPGGLAWSSATGVVASGSDFLTMADQRALLVRLDP